jgi:hypothetical protein
VVEDGVAERDVAELVPDGTVPLVRSMTVPFTETQTARRSEAARPVNMLVSQLELLSHVFQNVRSDVVILCFSSRSAHVQSVNIISSGDKSHQDRLTFRVNAIVHVKTITVDRCAGAYFFVVRYATVGKNGYFKHCIWCKLAENNMWLQRNAMTHHSHSDWYSNDNLAATCSFLQGVRCLD